MHEACIIINKPDMTLSFRANGHVGYETAGRDIVCASASILSMTLIEKLKAAYKAGWIDDTASASFSAEDTIVSCTAVDMDAFDELFRDYIFVATGYKLLAENYPDYVSFDIEIQT